MNEYRNIFLNKKILVYGLGKSGESTFKYLNSKNHVFLYDDNQLKKSNSLFKKKFLSHQKILKTNFDIIILSPGIDIDRCKISKYLKKNKKKIYTDLDVFYSFYKNDYITITGTNGKSTTCQLLYEVLLKQNFDVRLIGNIGNPVLSLSNIKKKTIFVIEASSYQLEYSKIFCSKYAAILNISPDHLERHKTLKRYIKAKIKLLKNQPVGSFSFVKKNDYLIKKEIRSNKFNNKILEVDTNRTKKFVKKINNEYFQNNNYIENLSFVLAISQKLKLKNKPLVEAISKFKGLKYRQQVIFKNSKLLIINDSKSTSFSSSLNILKSNSNILWLLGGISKKGDKFNLPRKFFTKIKAFIYGKNVVFFNKALKNKIEFENFDNLNNALKKIFSIIKKKKSRNVILFSPCAASFDEFKNFEDRGFYFNKLIKKYLNGKKLKDI